ncbi:hypothetical protein AB9F39_35475, partial [Rhizobium leguminosarum]
REDLCRLSRLQGLTRHPLGFIRGSGNAGFHQHLVGEGENDSLEPRVRLSAHQEIQAVAHLDGIAGTIGNGWFMSDRGQAEILAQSLVEVANGAG